MQIHSNTLHKLTSQILSLVLPVTAFLIPLFFLPTTADFYGTNKQLAVFVIAAISLISWSLNFLSAPKKSARLDFPPLTLPMLALAAIYLISSLIQSTTPTVSLLGRTTTIISLIIIYLTTVSHRSGKHLLQMTFTGLTSSIALISVFTLYHFFGLDNNAVPTSWLENPNFNPAGGSLGFLTIAIPLVPATLYLALKSKNIATKTFYFLSTTLVIIAAIMAGNLLLDQSGDTPNIIHLPYIAGWHIAVDNLKTLRTAFLGSGPETFVNTFTRFRPAFFNASPFWNQRLTTSSNEYLHILTTTGVLGLAAYLFMTIRTLLVSFNQKADSPFQVATRTLLVLLLVAQIFFPASITGLTLTFIALSLLTISFKDSPLHTGFSLSLKSLKPKDIFFDKSKVSSAMPPFFPWTILIASSTLVIATSYFRIKAYAAEVNFYRSLEAASTNDGRGTYNLQIKAIGLSPRDPRFHLAYSQTNLALANAIAQAGTENLSDQDKANITQLIQQAIREGKNAVSLDPQSAAAWQNLGNIYRQLIGLADNADQWTLAAYRQAIALDPLNPTLRFELGSLYFTQGNYEAAIRYFTQAAEAKPDWANAYYNLSAAYRNNQQPQQALEAMRIVVRLVEPTSSDFQLAEAELKQLEALVGSAQAPVPTPTQNSELSLPSEGQAPIQAPVELPEESSPDDLPEPEAAGAPEAGAEEEVNTDLGTGTPTPTP